MEKMTFMIHVVQNQPGGMSWEFWRDLVFLKAGTFAGGNLWFYESGGGATQDRYNREAQWRMVSLAIQGARSLTIGATLDPVHLKFFAEHTSLSDKISWVEIAAFHVKDGGRYRQNEYGYLVPDYGLHIFDVTVIPAMPTVQGVTWLVLHYSGATKEWF